MSHAQGHRIGVHPHSLVGHTGGFTTESLESLYREDHHDGVHRRLRVSRSIFPPHLVAVGFRGLEPEPRNSGIRGAHAPRDTVH